MDSHLQLLLTCARVREDIQAATTARKARAVHRVAGRCGAHRQAALAAIAHWAPGSAGDAIGPASRRPPTSTSTGADTS